MDRWRREKVCARQGTTAAHAHLSGITERGMLGLAQLFVQRGFLVTGFGPADGPDVERLRRMGVRIEVHAGQSYRRCPRSTRWFVHGAEIGPTHPERLSAKRRGLTVQTTNQCLAALLGEGVGLALAGGRAAGVASAMIGWVLTCSGRDPTVVLGRSAPQLGGWSRSGRGPHVVVEAVGGQKSSEGWDAMAPGPDRPPRPGGGVGMRAGGRDIPGPGPVGPRRWARTGDGRERLGRGGAAAAGGGGRVARAGAWGRLVGRRPARGPGPFPVPGVPTGAVTSSRSGSRSPGRRNVLSALAAIAACDRLDVSALEIKQALEEFTGVSRDFESRGSYRGVTLIDDEGEDPATVGQALRLGRQIFGTRRIWAVVAAPGTVSGSEEIDRWIAALAPADEVVLPGRADLLPATTPAGTDDAGDAGLSELAEALRRAGIRARRVDCLDDAIKELDRHLEPGDVLVTLGAGDVGTISDAFIRRLPRDRPGR